MTRVGNECQADKEILKFCSIETPSMNQDLLMTSYTTLTFVTSSTKSVLGLLF